MTNKIPTVDEILQCHSTPFWLKNALESALIRDPVDAANDAEVLSQVLQHRAHQQARYMAGVSEQSKHQMMKMEDLRSK